MKIYVFDRAGLQWADYRLPEGTTALRTIAINTNADAVRHLKNETGRIAALIERAQMEIKQDPMTSIRERSFFGRLKWLVTGK